MRPFTPELARFDGYTNAVWGVTTIDWPDLDHPAIITTSDDGTARIWDPHHPGTELSRFS